MTKKTIFFLLILFIGFGMVLPQASVQGQMAALIGKWMGTGGEWNLYKSNKTYQAHLKEPIGWVDVTGYFQTNDTKNPKHIDYKISTILVDGAPSKNPLLPEPGEVIKGIYKIEGNKLQVSIERDPDKPRPTNFDNAGTFTKSN